MAYERVNWENLPSKNTPVNADNLNKMDTGIANIENELKLNKNTIQEQQKQIEQLQKEIKELKGDNSSWVSLGNTVYYKKMGNIVTIRGYSLNNVALNIKGYKTIATLPQEIRPSIELAFPWTPIGENTIGLVRISLDGTLDLYSENGTAWWAFTITYII